MTSVAKLKSLLILGAIYNLAFIAYFFLPGQSGLVVALLIVIASRFIRGKALSNGGTKLEPKHRKIYFAATCCCALLWLSLLLTWIIRHSSPPAWAMGSLGIMVLLTLLYASYNDIYGPHAKV